MRAVLSSLPSSSIIVQYRLCATAAFLFVIHATAALFLQVISTSACLWRRSRRHRFPSIRAPSSLEFSSSLIFYTPLSLIRVRLAPDRCVSSSSSPSSSSRVVWLFLCYCCFASASLFQVAALTSVLIALQSMIGLTYSPAQRSGVTARERYPARESARGSVRDVTQPTSCRACV